MTLPFLSIADVCVPQILANRWRRFRGEMPSPCSRLDSTSTVRSPLNDVEKVDEQTSERPTDDGADQRDRRVSPVRMALSGNWQNLVRDSGTEIARGIHAGAGWPGHRYDDRPNECADQERSERSGHRAGPGNPRNDGDGNKHEREGGDDLGDQVVPYVGNRRMAAKASELVPGIRRFRPVRQILQPDDYRAYEPAEHLRREIRQDLGIIAGRYGHREGNHWIDVRVGATAGVGGENPRHGRESPSRGDGDPAAAQTLRAPQGNAGNDAIPHDHQNQSAHELTHHCGMHRLTSCFWIRSQRACGTSKPSAPPGRTTVPGAYYSSRKARSAHRAASARRAEPNARHD